MTQSQISKAAASSIDHTVGTLEVQHFEGAKENWKVLLLSNVLQDLCLESEHFREALREVVTQSGP